MDTKLKEMKNYLIIISVILISACGYPTKEENPKTTTVTIDSLHSYLTTLDLRLPESAGSALSYTQTVMQTMDEVRRDSAFILYRQFFYEVLMLQNEVLSNSEMIATALAERRQDVPELEYFHKKVTDNGMIFLQSEGFFYIDEHHNYLHDAFSKYVSDPIKKLLEIRKNEMQKGFSEDAALLISFKDLGERIRIWEQLLDENPTLKLQQEAKGYYNLYLSTFITGLDNTPTFDHQTKTIVPEAKEAYEDYISKHGGTHSGQIISNYYNTLKENNFKQPADLNSFLEENNIASMDGVQPPTR